MSDQDAKGMLDLTGDEPVQLTIKQTETIEECERLVREANQFFNENHPSGVPEEQRKLELKPTEEHKLLIEGLSEKLPKIIEECEPSSFHEGVMKTQLQEWRAQAEAGLKEVEQVQSQLPPKQNGNDGIPR